MSECVSGQESHVVGAVADPRIECFWFDSPLPSRRATLRDMKTMQGLRPRMDGVLGGKGVQHVYGALGSGSSVGEAVREPP